MFLIVLNYTGIIYSRQCNGEMNERKDAEGFLIPAGGPRATESFKRFFWRAYKRYNSIPVSEWDEEYVADLETIVERVPVFGPGSDTGERDFLRLNRRQLTDSVEAWLHVISPYGPAILTWPNSM